MEKARPWPGVRRVGENFRNFALRVETPDSYTPVDKDSHLESPAK